MASEGGFTVSVTGADEYEKCDSFDKFGLNEDLLRGIYSSCGYIEPTAFQQHGLRPVLGGRNIIGQGQNGVGKTAAGIIGALQKVNYSKNVCQALFLAPTREGAQSIYKLVVALGAHLNIRCVACTGGTSVRADLQKLKEGQHIVISTPGRVVDMVGKGQLQIDALSQFILDGADDILSRGLQEEIYKVFKKLPSKVQIQLYSASMTPELIDITTKFIHGAALIVVEKEEQTLDNVRQFYVAIEDDWKLDALCDLYETLTITAAVVYCNSRKNVDFLADQLLERQFTVSTLTADHDPKECELIIKEFNSGGSSILICTDLPSAIEPSKLVINYELPEDPELYLFRCGRSSGKGFVINFLVSDNDVQIKEDIENHFDVQMDEMPEDIEDII